MNNSIKAMRSRPFPCSSVQIGRPETPEAHEDDEVQQEGGEGEGGEVQQEDGEGSYGGEVQDDDEGEGRRQQTTKASKKAK